MDTSQVDESICLVCGGSTFVGETISCETCLHWFHFSCVGVSHLDDCVIKEDVPYFCPQCDVQGKVRAKKAKKQKNAREKLSQAQAHAQAQAQAQEQDVKDGNIECPTLPIMQAPEPPLPLPPCVPPSEGPAVVTQQLPILQHQGLSAVLEEGRLEEAEWLAAVESGNHSALQMCDSELRSLREPVTARQKGTNLNLMEMTDRTLEKREVEKMQETEEERAAKAIKRKEVETEKREKMKKKTMDTLLKKKEAKTSKQMKVGLNRDDSQPVISYRVSASGYSLSYPEGHDYPLAAQSPLAPPPATLCCMCDNRKKYNSSTTGQPVCSLKCYKENIAAVKLVS